MNNNKILILAIFVFSLGLKAPNEPEAQEHQGLVPQAENVEASTPALDEIGCEVEPEESNKILKGCIGMASAALAGLLLWKPIKNGLICRNEYLKAIKVEPDNCNLKNFCLRHIQNASVILDEKPLADLPCAYLAKDAGYSYLKIKDAHDNYVIHEIRYLHPPDDLVNYLNVIATPGDSLFTSNPGDKFNRVIELIRERLDDLFFWFYFYKINKQQFATKIGDENFNAKLASEFVARCFMAKNNQEFNNLFAEYVQLKVKQHENEMRKGYRSFWLSNLYSEESSISYKCFLTSEYLPR